MRSWHDAYEKFESPTALRARLAESFPDDLAEDLSFQVGYFQGKQGAKRWIVEPRDLEKMYAAFKKGKEIHLWCEGKLKPDVDSGPPPKRAKTGGNTRRELFEDEVDDIFKELKEKHQDMAGPKLRLWARLVDMMITTSPRNFTYFWLIYDY